MSIENVREYLKKFGLESKIIELEESSATVELAALALGVKSARIAKTLSFKKDDSCILVVTAGDTKIDNKKFRTEFGVKAKMLSPDEVLKYTTHPVGGVCPFGLPDCNVKVYCDVSMQRFGTVFPACGSCNSAIELSCDELFSVACAEKWVDVCVLRN